MSVELIRNQVAVISTLPAHIRHSASEPGVQAPDRIEPEEATRVIKRVAVVGLGYVGLPSAIALARAGYQVVGADVSARVVSAIEQGRSPLRDSVGDAEIAEALSVERFRATADTAEAVMQADFVMVCVPTPITHDRKPDLGPLKSASEAIGKGLRRGTVVSFESTTFPGCTEKICIPILERESGLEAGRDFGVAYCPERINPGDSAHTTESTPRVLGAIDRDSLEAAASVYSSFLNCPLHLCPDLRTAEASKVLENVQRDVNIALVNEFAMLCPRLGLDVHAVLEAAATKFNFMRVSPGPGVGGHCIPVDPWYLIEEARAHGFEPRLMVSAREVNEQATRAVADAVLSELAHAGVADRAANVALLGLSYKGGLGDLRESPSLRLFELLRSNVALVRVHDPRVEPSQVPQDLRDAACDIDTSVTGAHAIALLTDHPEFRGLDWKRIAKLAAPGALVVDARNLADPVAVRDAGLRYWGIGRGNA